MVANLGRFLLVLLGVLLAFPLLAEPSLDGKKRAQKPAKTLTPDELRKIFELPHDKFKLEACRIPQEIHFGLNHPELGPLGFVRTLAINPENGNYWANHILTNIGTRLRNREENDKDPHASPRREEAFYHHTLRNELQNSVAPWLQWNFPEPLPNLPVSDQELGWMTAGFLGPNALALHWAAVLADVRAIQEKDKDSDLFNQAWLLQNGREASLHALFGHFAESWCLPARKDLLIGAAIVVDGHEHADGFEYSLVDGNFVIEKIFEVKSSFSGFISNGRKKIRNLLIRLTKPGAKIEFYGKSIHPDKIRIRGLGGKILTLTDIANALHLDAMETHVNGVSLADIPDAADLNWPGFVAAANSLLPEAFYQVVLPKDEAELLQSQLPYLGQVYGKITPGPNSLHDLRENFVLFLLEAFPNRHLNDEAVYQVLWSRSDSRRFEHLKVQRPARAPRSEKPKPDIDLTLAAEEETLSPAIIQKHDYPALLERLIITEPNYTPLGELKEQKEWLSKVLLPFLENRLIFQTNGELRPAHFEKNKMVFEATTEARGLTILWESETHEPTWIRTPTHYTLKLPMGSYPQMTEKNVSMMNEGLMGHDLYIYQTGRRLRQARMAVGNAPIRFKPGQSHSEKVFEDLLKEKENFGVFFAAPPGYGKTLILARSLRTFLTQKPQSLVLVVTETQVGIDQITEELYDQLQGLKVGLLDFKNLKQKTAYPDFKAWIQAREKYGALVVTLNWAQLKGLWANTQPGDRDLLKQALGAIFIDEGQELKDPSYLNMVTELNAKVRYGQSAVFIEPTILKPEGPFEGRVVSVYPELQGVKPEEVIVGGWRKGVELGEITPLKQGEDGKVLTHFTFQKIIEICGEKTQTAPEDVTVILSGGSKYPEVYSRVGDKVYLCLAELFHDVDPAKSFWQTNRTLIRVNRIDQAEHFVQALHKYFSAQNVKLRIKALHNKTPKPEEVFEGLRSDDPEKRINIVVSPRMMDRAANVPQLSAAMLIAQAMSAESFIEVSGRVNRTAEGKTVAQIVQISNEPNVEATMMAGLGKKMQGLVVSAATGDVTPTKLEGVEIADTPPAVSLKPPPEGRIQVLTAAESERYRKLIEESQKVIFKDNESIDDKLLKMQRLFLESLFSFLPTPESMRELRHKFGQQNDTNKMQMLAKLHQTLVNHIENLREIFTQIDELTVEKTHTDTNPQARIAVLLASAKAQAELMIKSGDPAVGLQDLEWTISLLQTVALYVFPEAYQSWQAVGALTDEEVRVAVERSHKVLYMPHLSGIPKSQAEDLDRELQKLDFVAEHITPQMGLGQRINVAININELLINKILLSYDLGKPVNHDWLEKVIRLDEVFFPGVYNYQAIRGLKEKIIERRCSLIRHPLDKNTLPAVKVHKAWFILRTRSEILQMIQDLRRVEKLVLAEIAKQEDPNNRTPFDFNAFEQTHKFAILSPYLPPFGKYQFSSTSYSLDVLRDMLADTRRYLKMAKEVMEGDFEDHELGKDQIPFLETSNVYAFANLLDTKIAEAANAPLPPKVDDPTREFLNRLRDYLLLFPNELALYFYLDGLELYFKSPDDASKLYYISYIKQQRHLSALIQAFDALAPADQKKFKDLGFLPEAVRAVAGKENEGLASLEKIKEMAKSANASPTKTEVFNLPNAMMVLFGNLSLEEVRERFFKEDNFLESISAEKLKEISLFLDNQLMRMKAFKETSPPKSRYMISEFLMSKEIRKLRMFLQIYTNNPTRYCDEPKLTMAEVDRLRAEVEGFRDQIKQKTKALKQIKPHFSDLKRSKLLGDWSDEEKATLKKLDELYAYCEALADEKPQCLENLALMWITWLQSRMQLNLDQWATKTFANAGEQRDFWISARAFYINSIKAVLPWIKKNTEVASDYQKSLEEFAKEDKLTLRSFTNGIHRVISQATLAHLDKFMLQDMLGGGLDENLLVQPIQNAPTIQLFPITDNAAQAILQTISTLTRVPTAVSTNPTVTYVTSLQTLVRKMKILELRYEQLKRQGPGSDFSSSAMSLNEEASNCLALLPFYIPGDGTLNILKILRLPVPLHFQYVMKYLFTAYSDIFLEPQSNRVSRIEKILKMNKAAAIQLEKDLNDFERQLTDISKSLSPVGLDSDFSQLSSEYYTKRHAHITAFYELVNGLINSNPVLFGILNQDQIPITRVDRFSFFKAWIERVSQISQEVKRALKGEYVNDTLENSVGEMIRVDTHNAIGLASLPDEEHIEDCILLARINELTTGVPQRNRIPGLALDKDQVLQKLRDYIQTPWDLLLNQVLDPTKHSYMERRKQAARFLKDFLLQSQSILTLMNEQPEHFSELLGLQLLKEAIAEFAKTYYITRKCTAGFSLYSLSISAGSVADKLFASAEMNLLPARSKLTDLKTGALEAILRSLVYEKNIPSISTDLLPILLDQFMMHHQISSSMTVKEIIDLVTSQIDDELKERGKPKNCKEALAQEGQAEPEKKTGT